MSGSIGAWTTENIAAAGGRECDQGASSEISLGELGVILNSITCIDSCC